MDREDVIAAVESRPHWQRRRSTRICCNKVESTPDRLEDQISILAEVFKSIETKILDELWKNTIYTYQWYFNLDFFDKGVMFLVHDEMLNTVEVILQQWKNMIVCICRHVIKICSIVTLIDMFDFKNSMWWLIHTRTLIYDNSIFDLTENIGQWKNVFYNNWIWMLDLVYTAVDRHNNETIVNVALSLVNCMQVIYNCNTFYGFDIFRKEIDWQDGTILYKSLTWKC